MNERKTDRRTLYTRSVIKEALLELFNEKSYDRIKIAEVCRKAEISRGTFYLHYDNLDEVLDDIIDDALFFSEKSGKTTLIDSLEAVKTKHASDLRNVLPACQRIADSRRYHQLFMDPTISNRIIHRLYVHERDKIIPPLMARSHLSREEAEMVFRFILHGSFAVNRALGWDQNEKWYRIQEILMNFMNGGLDSV